MKDKNAPCGFELIYYFNAAAAGSNRESVGAIRFQAGCELAKIFCIKGDIVVPVPNTAREVAQGYAYSSDIKYVEAIIANPKYGRYFAQPTAEGREKVVNEKFSYLPEEIAGKDIVLVDDSIVRGSTTKIVIQKLRELGAGKIHMMVASSPVLSPCERLQVKSRAELVATDRTIGQIRDMIGADSLYYLPLDIALGIYGSRSEGEEVCLDCFS